MIEIEALKLSEQELFDKAAMHLITQKSVAVCKVKGRTKCTYENKRTKKRCAVGGILTDSEIKQLRLAPAEGSMAFDLGWGVLIHHEVVPDNHKELLKNLQILHDRYSNAGPKTVIDFKPGLELLANQFKLEWKYADV